MVDFESKEKVIVEAEIEVERNGEGDVSEMKTIVSPNKKDEKKIKKKEKKDKEKKDKRQKDKKGMYT